MNGLAGTEIVAWDTGSDLHGYACPLPQPQAIALVVHGFGEHALRHSATMRAWAGRGIASYAYDHRGHGRSPGRRAVVERLDDLVSDAIRIRERVIAAHPGVPVFLFGVSMGGLVATRSAQRSSTGLSGIVLLSPAFALAENVPAFLRAMLRAVRRVAPFVNAAPPLAVARLSRDPAVGIAYAADPLNHHGGVPVCTGTELVDGGDAAIAEAATFVLPALIFAGDADAIAFPIGSLRFRDAATKNADLTLTVVPGGYHEVFNDPGGETLIAAAADWMLARI